MDISHEIFENGPIRIVQTWRENYYVYSIIFEDFSQMILTQDAFDSLKELMVAFHEEDMKEDEDFFWVKQEQLDFTIQEGEYG